MKIITDIDEVAVLRTDFSNDNVWSDTCKKVSAPHPEFGFTPNLNFINSPEYGCIDKFNVKMVLPEDYEHEIIFLIDQTTIEDKENSLLCVGLLENEGKSFRVIPTEVWSVENNLSLANMDFDEFFQVAENGVFKGFD